MAEIAFLLDEHYPASLAEALRSRGLDVRAVVAVDPPSSASLSGFVWWLQAAPGGHA